MRFVLLLIAAAVAVVAGVAALQYTSRSPAPVPGQPNPVHQTASDVSTVEVLVARQPIEVGTTIEDAMVDRQPWPSHLVLDNFITVNSKNADIVGKVARAPFQAREPFMADKLANPNDPSFLAAMLPEGMRAMTIATDAVAGVAGYVFPGDRIDVLFTHNVPQDIRADARGELGARSTQKPAVTEVLAGNLRVLAVNVREAPGKASSPTPSSVTVEVSAQQAEQLRLAEKVGTLSLSLRSLKDKDDNGIPKPSMLYNVTRVHLIEQEGTGVRVVHGVGGHNRDNNTYRSQPQLLMAPVATEGQ